MRQPLRLLKPLRRPLKLHQRQLLKPLRRLKKLRRPLRLLRLLKPLQLRKLRRKKATNPPRRNSMAITTITVRTQAGKAPKAHVLKALLNGKVLKARVPKVLLRDGKAPKARVLKALRNGKVLMARVLTSKKAIVPNGKAPKAHVLISKRAISQKAPSLKAKKKT